jgi:signal peptidase II
MSEHSTPGELSPAPPTVAWPVWIGLSVAVVAIDQWTKSLILEAFAWGGGHPVTDFFNLIRVHNTGVAFSFMASNEGWQRWFFSVLGGVACAVMIWLLKINSKERFFCFSLAMIMGGAMGNVLDRLRLGYVVDFLDFHWHAWHFPAFNAADSAITLGACCLIVDELIKAKRKSGPASQDPGT